MSSLLPEQLRGRDYTLIIDRSGSMSTKDVLGGKSRWQAVQETTLALARYIASIDADGITVYTFSTKFKRYDEVKTEDRVREIFSKDPIGDTNLAEVLKHAIDDYFQRKANEKAKPNGEIFLIITDGEPDNKQAVRELIKDTTYKIERDEEIGISLIQIGNDQDATRFLKELDNELENLGAKFDICNTLTFEELADYDSLEEVLLSAIND